MSQNVVQTALIWEQFLFHSLSPQTLCTNKVQRTNRLILLPLFKRFGLASVCHSMPVFNRESVFEMAHWLRMGIIFPFSSWLPPCRWFTDVADGGKIENRDNKPVYSFWSYPVGQAFPNLKLVSKATHRQAYRCAFQKLFSRMISKVSSWRWTFCTH